MGTQSKPPSGFLASYVTGLRRRNSERGHLCTFAVWGTSEGETRQQKRPRSMLDTRINFTKSVSHKLCPVFPKQSWFSLEEGEFQLRPEFTFHNGEYLLNFFAVTNQETNRPQKTHRETLSFRIRLEPPETNTAPEDTPWRFTWSESVQAFHDICHSGRCDLKRC